MENTQRFNSFNLSGNAPFNYNTKLNLHPKADMKYRNFTNKPNSFTSIPSTFNRVPPPALKTNNR
jgi:hypothetical protein